VAIVAAFVGMVVRFLCVRMLVQMLVVVGLRMVMHMGVAVRVSVGDTVVGVLVGVGMFVAVATYMIVVDMHRGISFIFSFIILGKRPCVKENL